MGDSPVTAVTADTISLRPKRDDSARIQRLGAPGSGMFGNNAALPVFISISALFSRPPARSALPAPCPSLGAGLFSAAPSRE
jgi:hypothetical protein